VVRKGKAAELIISKTRAKDSGKKGDVSGDFYAALDKKVRELIAGAESRAIANKRKTLKPRDRSADR
jgi:histone H3/H4